MPKKAPAKPLRPAWREQTSARTRAAGKPIWWTLGTPNNQAMRHIKGNSIMGATQTLHRIPRNPTRVIGAVHRNGVLDETFTGHVVRPKRRQDTHADVTSNRVTPVSKQAKVHARRLMLRKAAKQNVPHLPRDVENLIMEHAARPRPRQQQ